MTEKSDCTPAWFKVKTSFIQHEEKLLETRLELLQGFITPIPHFFVRNASQRIAVDAGDWSFTLHLALCTLFFTKRNKPMRQSSSLFLVSLFVAVASWLLPASAGSVAAMSVGAIVTPASGSVVQGVAQVKGIAQHPGFRKWQLDLLLHGDEGKAAFIAVGETMQTEAGLLAHLDTTRFPNGAHKLRLRVVYTGLNYDEYFTPIIIGNTGAPVVAPTPDASKPEETAAVPVPEQKPKDDLLNDPALVEQQGGGRHKLPYAITALPPIGQGVSDGRRWIEVDLSDYKLTAWQGDVPVFQTIVAIGKPGFETITGNFKVYRKYEKTRMRGVDYDTPDVPWTMYYKGGFAVHGAYWHNEFGTKRSHGCVNVKLHEAKVLFEWAEVGTEVVVHE